MIVVSYDIVDDKCRSKVSQALLDHGTRVQYSVFEIDDSDKLDEIANKLVGLIDQKEDSIRYYQLCQGCVKRKKVVGKDRSSINNDTGYIII